MACRRCLQTLTRHTSSFLSSNPQSFKTLTSHLPSLHRIQLIHPHFRPQSNPNRTFSSTPKHHNKPPPTASFRRFVSLYTDPLSSLGLNLKTSTFSGENLCVAFICVFGLVLFLLLIGNMQVIGRWHPQDASKPELEEVPVLYPTEEICPKAEQFGICRMVPPPSWKSPCPLKENDKWERSKFAARVQKVDKLQNRDALRKLLKAHSHAMKKRRRCLRMGTESGAGSGKNSEQPEVEFGFEPGPEFTLAAFQRRLF